MEPDLAATNHKNNQETINALSNSLVKAVFENVQEGIMLFDNRGNLLEINNAGLELHGIEADEKEGLLNKPFNFSYIYDAVRKEQSEQNSPLVRLLNGEAFKDIDYIVKLNPHEPEIRIRYSGIPQLDNEGILTTGILIAHKSEVTDIKSELINDVYTQEEQIKELELYQQQLKHDRELLQTIIDAIPVMITIYDRQLGSFTMNRTFEQISGWRNQDLKSSNIMELAYPDPEYRKKVFKYMQSLAPGFKDIIIRTRDGRDLETSWANVKIPDGRQVGVGIDISQRKRLEKELIKARERAEWENQVQYAFIQNISHEVRTPMNSILGFTELLQKELKGEKEAEFLNAIAFNGKQLLRLINDIIDFSRLDNNQIHLNKEQLVVGDFLQKIDLQIKGMKNTYNKRNLNVIMNQSDSGVKALLHTDSYRLQQVLYNLIGNAIKYTREGKVEFGYKIRESKHDVLFYVKDTGIGIHESDKKKVFKRFNRLHDTRSFEFRGTGLGLAICKHLVKLLGGDIWFDSELGKGTTFYFSHPFHDLKKAESYHSLPFAAENYQDEINALPDLKDKVILIVEDDSFSYMMMYHMLEETRALILHADSGTKAVEIFEKYKIDLAFLDIRIPDMDGYQVIRYFHKINEGVPVIAQTANALPEDKKKLANAGFDAHIAKPISREILFNVLNKFLPVEKTV